MICKNLSRKKALFIILIFLIIIEFNFIIIKALGDTNVPGYTHQNKIQAGNKEIFNFTNNNIIFEIKTDSFLDINFNIDPQIFQRETFLSINNSNSPLGMNITTRSNLDKFNIQKQPKGPTRGNFQYKYRYNNILRIRTNSTIQKLTLQYLKNTEYGLNPNQKYIIAVFHEGNNSWNILTTTEIINETTEEIYLKTEINDFRGEEDYFFTIFEIEVISYDWIWFIVIFGAIGILALVILLSKQDYIHFLKTRTIPIDKGAHQLTLEEVLENENRSKIIDLILQEPGIHFNDLLRKTDLSGGNLAWHLDILETYKVIGKKRVGRYLVYFPYYQKNPLSNIDLKLQKSELTLKVLEIIELNPGTYNSEIKKELNVDHKTISYHIQKLKDLDLIKIEKIGRKKKLYPNLEAEYYNNKNN